ncbi:ion channel [Thiomicrorhabdus sp.]|uniref:ion channel n=1 Tax=Thiomicrorhabdus sp. TaxID=2039724 RepID=UPI0029C8B187|nr:ion channel [Thiomicrorhabdus sp.]
MNVKAVLGVAGVHRAESDLANKVGRMFESLVLLALLAVFVQIVLFYSGYVFEPPWFNALVWGVFALEMLANLFLVRDRWRYVRQNWLNLAIVVLAFPMINWGSSWVLVVRSLRLILLIRFFTSFFKDAIIILKSNRFGQTLIGFALLIIGAGSIFAYLEDRSFVDGIWYAIVTITTVGYGDVVPQSEHGRIFGAVLILFGVLFFSLVTANISAFLIGSDQRRLEKDILEYMKQTENRLAKQSLQNEKYVERLMTHYSAEIASLKKELSEMRKRERMEEINARLHQDKRE